MKTLRTVGAASVLVGGLFHLAGPAVFDLPLIGDAMSRIWNFGVGPATVQRLFGLVAVPVIGMPVKGALNSMEDSLVPDETNSYSV